MSVCLARAAVCLQLLISQCACMEDALVQHGNTHPFHLAQAAVEASVKMGKELDDGPDRLMNNIKNSKLCLVVYPAIP